MSVYLFGGPGTEAGVGVRVGAGAWVEAAVWVQETIKKSEKVLFPFVKAPTSLFLPLKERL